MSGTILRPRAWIRPVYVDNRLASIALARTDGEILVDEDIIDHFPADSRGVDIRLAAMVDYDISPTRCEWGAIIDIEE